MNMQPLRVIRRKKKTTKIKHEQIGRVLSFEGTNLACHRLMHHYFYRHNFRLNFYIYNTLYFIQYTIEYNEYFQPYGGGKEVWFVRLYYFYLFHTLLCVQEYRSSGRDGAMSSVCTNLVATESPIPPLCLPQHMLSLTALQQQHLP